MLCQALVLTSRREYAQAMRAILIGLGIGRVDIELDALRAMELAPQSYELILIDSALDGMDGLQLLFLMRRRAPDATFVIIGEKGDEATAILARENGADLFLVRPGTAEAYQKAAAEIKERLQPAPPPLAERPPAEVDPSALITLAGDTTAASSWELPSEAPPREEGAVQPAAPRRSGPVPPASVHWKVDLMGNLMENSPGADPDHCALLTNFIYRKLADVAVALEVDYFRQATLWGPQVQQVLVADNLSVRHALFETASVTESQRDDYVKGCRETGL